MKIYTRKAFLDLPEGVLFAKGVRWAFDHLNVKGKTLPATEGYSGDFLYRDLCNIDMGADSGEWAYRLETMLHEHASFPLEDGYGRDGRFNEDDVFLVFETDDLQELIAVAFNALAIRV